MSGVDPLVARFWKHPGGNSVGVGIAKDGHYFPVGMKVF